MTNELSQETLSIDMGESNVLFNMFKGLSIEELMMESLNNTIKGPKKYFKYFKRIIDNPPYPFYDNLICAGLDKNKARRVSVMCLVHGVSDYNKNRIAQVVCAGRIYKKEFMDIYDNCPYIFNVEKIDIEIKSILAEKIKTITSDRFIMLLDI